MKVNGSVLIVVLGLLAILAVVGVAFVTMSSIDRATAANFAANTQLMMAADSGVDYAAHYLVNDVWKLDASVTPPKQLLLTNTTGYEVYDCPGIDADGDGELDDAWLSDRITTTTGDPSSISFEKTSPTTCYGIPFNYKGTAGCDNLIDIPNSGSTRKNGVFISDLAFPYESRVGRVSITILDHGGLINLNAHGNRPWTGGPSAEFLGRGYYISDVNPACTGAPLANLTDILFNGRTLGRWGASGNIPNITELGETAIENPVLGMNPNYPFTVDEEFELRRVQANPLNGGSPGTLARSRIELMGPGNSMTAAQRLMYTTVGWTAQVRGDVNAPDHRTVNGYSRPKADLNRDTATLIYEALNDGRAGTSKQLGQLAANVVAFRSSGHSFKPITVTGATGSPFVGADRQPLITEASCQLTHASSDPTDNNVYEVKVEVHNPWRAEVPGADGPLDTRNMTVNAAGATENLPDTMNPDAFHVVTKSVSLSPAENIANKSIKLTVNRGKEVTLDEVAGTDMGNLATGGHLSRKIYVTSETRGTDCSIPILYLRDWETGAAASWNSVVPDASLDNTVPIRFPNSVTTADQNGTVATTTAILPPFGAAPSFRGIARLGDLDQVLCPEDESAATNFWPWTNRVAKCNSVTGEAALKFNWKPKGALGVGTSDLSLAANVLCVGGPWNDNLDNDGDNVLDAADTATSSSTNTGRYAGPEFRVAGLINLNTASPTGTLLAMNDGLGISLTAADLVGRPFRTPAQILNTVGPGTGPEAKGFLEKRDWVFNRVSNIVTVRSDTFSVYGTAQLVTISGSTPTVTASRRFWALLDRSVSLAYPPTRSGVDNLNFIHPRILNFQWLD